MKRGAAPAKLVDRSRWVWRWRYVPRYQKRTVYGVISKPMPLSPPAIRGRSASGTNQNSQPKRVWRLGPAGQVRVQTDGRKPKRSVIGTMTLKSATLIGMLRPPLNGPPKIGKKQGSDRLHDEMAAEWDFHLAHTENALTKIGHPLHAALQMVLCAYMHSTFFATPGTRPCCRRHINTPVSTVGAGASFPGIVGAPETGAGRRLP
jgi:hypothetical protein